MAQNDAASFEVEGGPGTLVVEGGGVNEMFGAGRTVEFLLLEDCTEAIAIDVKTQTYWAGIVGDGVPAKWTKIGGVARSWRSCRTMASIAGVKTNLTPCCEGVDEAGTCGRVRDKLEVLFIAKISEA